MTLAAAAGLTLAERARLVRAWEREEQMRDYELTRQFLRHEDIATTARYVTAPPNHLAASVLVGDGWEDDADA